MPLVKLARTGEAPTPTAYTVAKWARSVGADVTSVQIEGVDIGRRSSAQVTTEQTGLRREEVGGIIIGVTLGLILVILLFWCCFARRRSSGTSDTDSEWSVSITPPPPPPPPPPEKPPPVKTPRPPAGRFELTDDAYKQAKFKSLTTTKGITYAEGHTGGEGRSKAVAWTRRKKNLKLGDDEINTLEEHGSKP